METDILNEIASQRKEAIAAQGYTLGCAVPAARWRGEPVPFVAARGVILEIKRASPSKGDIAPGLDAAATAAAYARAGAAAISVLTEGRFFKGSLDDLMAAARAADEYAAEHGTSRVAVLRKDFLLAPEEVDVAYRAGADAVLLIARLLDAGTLEAMAMRCAELGMTAFIELRLEEDVRKLAEAAARVDARRIVCGVNARDLADFSIDLLQPAGLLGSIRQALGEDARVVFESGIRTPQAAAFAGALGFTGMLLGEAAARSPADAAALVDGFVRAEPTPHAAAWLGYAAALRERRAAPPAACSHRRPAGGRPFLKVCGLTSVHDALYATLGGADFLGFIFCAKSPRNVDPAVISRVREVLDEEFNQTCQDEHIFAAGEDDPPPRLVGVITECASPEARAAIELARKGVLDFLQLHGAAAVEQFFADPALAPLPHYAAVNVAGEADLAAVDALRRRGEPRVLLDARAGGLLGGTGVRVDAELVRRAAARSRLWLAGGITPENVRAVISEFRPELLDVCSGVEASPGKKDTSALLRLAEEMAAAL